MEEFLTYEQFGAIGDGVADDMPAIVRTHAEANRLGLPVRAAIMPCIGSPIVLPPLKSAPIPTGATPPL